MADKFGMGSMGLGSLSSVLDSMELVKRAWSSFNIPANLTPTLDIDELDRRIKDMKAVEQWLSMNLGMLQGTIQGMEVQRGTLAALQAFGQSVSAPAADPATFAAQAMAAMQRAAAPAAPKPSAETPRPAASEPEAPAAEPEKASTGAEAGLDPAGMAAELSRATAAAVNPTAWWNLLQSQFEQVAQAALRSGAMQGEPGPASAEATPAKRPPRPAPAKAAGKAATGSKASGTRGAPRSGTKPR